MSDPVFRFAPRWKEELVVTGPGGAFLLEMPMGDPCVLLPTEDAFGATAPDWARGLWPALHEALTDWCQATGTPLALDADAPATPLADQRVTPLAD